MSAKTMQGRKAGGVNVKLGNGRTVWLDNKTLASIQNMRLETQRQSLPRRATRSNNANHQQPYIIMDASALPFMIRWRGIALTVFVTVLVTVIGLLAIGAKPPAPLDLLPSVLFIALIMFGVLVFVFLVSWVWNYHQDRLKARSGSVVISPEELEWAANTQQQQMSVSEGSIPNVQATPVDASQKQLMAMQAQPQRLPTLGEQIAAQVNSGAMAVYMVDEEIPLEINTWDIITQNIEQQRELEQQQQLPPSIGQQ